MKYPTAILFLALCDCSGASATLGGAPDSALALGAAVEGDALGAADTVSEPAAPDASADRVQGVDASAVSTDAGALDTVDAVPVCSPVTVSPQSSCPGTTVYTYVTFPADYLVVSSAPDAGGDCRTDWDGVYATPPPCQCRETFTCQCLQANAAQYTHGLGSSCIMFGGAPYGVH